GRRDKPTKMRKKRGYTILLSCLLDGMASPSRTGFTSFMALGLSIDVKYAQIMFTWGGKLVSSSSAGHWRSYMRSTRKNFDRHFQESRHAFGMRALGLPNTKHFHEITRIEDALSRMSNDICLQSQIIDLF